MRLVLCCFITFCAVRAEPATPEVSTAQEVGISTSLHPFCGSDECSNVTVDGETVAEGSGYVDFTTIKSENESFPTESNSLVNTTTTLTTPALTTTTEIPVLPTTAKRPNIEDSCSCDEVRGLCNINCCCDVDCSESDRKAFSHCHPEPEGGHSGLCYKQQFIYSNNTRYKIIQHEKGMFCIARDNFPERLFFSNQKTIHTTASFNRAIQRKQQFTWPQISLPPTDVFETTSPYKSGVPVWIYNNATGSIRTLEIPLTSGTVSCKSSRTVRYLDDFESECLHRTISKEECEDSQSILNGKVFCENIVVITSPLLINQTKIEESPDGAFMLMRMVECRANGSDCKEVRNASNPTFDTESNSCRNAALGVQYVFYHNSTSGITEAECQLSVGPLPLSKYFAQRINVVFKWAKNESEAFPRSGLPGYLQGKPLISGNLLTGIAGSVKRESVNMSSVTGDWLSLPVANKNGLCSGKKNVLFKENVRTQCGIHVSREALLSQEGCSLLKEEVWKIIFGDMKVNRSDPRQLLSLISAFGDPSPDAPDDWVPIFLDRSVVDQQVQIPCPTQLSGVQYRVLYSYFGPFTNPQMKIIGLYATLSSKDVVCKVDGCQMKIVTSVNFLDVSQEAVNKFAKAPVVKIRLPPDFFYPFSSQSCQNISNMLLMLIALAFPARSWL
uniref:Tectonic-1 n=3 Tax=Lygus hesperus TaxID=30085 RepID=A0A146LMB0_LYGHE